MSDVGGVPKTSESHSDDVEDETVDASCSKSEHEENILVFDAGLETPCIGHWIIIIACILRWYCHPTNPSRRRGILSCFKQSRLHVPRAVAALRGTAAATERTQGRCRQMRTPQLVLCVVLASCGRGVEGFDDEDLEILKGSLQGCSFSPNELSNLDAGLGAGCGTQRWTR